MSAWAETQDAVPSPCISVCELDAAEVCQGCGRSLTEIAAWPGASRAEQLAIIERAKARLNTGSSS